MKLKQLFTDDDAVSPVIGVILMVAITVILAAVIATFVLGLGESVSSTAPQANFQEDYTEYSSGVDDSFRDGITADGNLTVSHTGGDKITAANLYMTGSSVYSDRVSWDNDTEYTDVTAGNSIDYAANTTDTVRVIWSDDSEGTSAELSKWTGPDA
ncbi:type IV pilin [Halapricum desulfuricans]|nr:type IV pilin N-terminal domain-containing protein [Halapricum desulfuricans]